MRRAKIIGFISIKGGVGKTTTVANLGFILANDFKKKVLVVDGNFSGPNLALHFGFTKPNYTLHDALAGKINLQKAIYEHSSGLHILPASLFAHSVDCSKFHQNIASDELFVLTTPDYVTLASTMHAIKVARQKRTYISGIIINKLRSKKFELNLDSIQDATKVPVVSVLFDDETVMRALAKGKPVSHLFGKNGVAVEYRKLAAALIGERYIDKRLLTRFKGMFNKRLSQDEINRAIVMVSHY